MSDVVESRVGRNFEGEGARVAVCDVGVGTRTLKDISDAALIILLDVSDGIVTIELAYAGIRVNVMHTGGVNSAGVAETARLYVAAAFARMVPLGRIGEADEIGRTALFLSTDASHSIDASLVADGRNTAGQAFDISNLRKAARHANRAEEQLKQATYDPTTCGPHCGSLRVTPERLNSKARVSQYDPPSHAGVSYRRGDSVFASSRSRRLTRGACEYATQTPGPRVSYVDLDLGVSSPKGWENALAPATGVVESFSKACARGFLCTKMRVGMRIWQKGRSTRSDVRTLTRHPRQPTKCGGEGGRQ